MTSPGPAVHLDPMTPLALLERTLRVFPDRPAVIYGDLRWSQREFADEVGRLAGALLRAGVEPGDRVAFLAPNVPALLAAHFAVLQVEAVLVAINTRLQAEEVGYILAHSGARLVFCDVELAPVVQGALTSLPSRPQLVNVEDPAAGQLACPLRKAAGAFDARVEFFRLGLA
jgi:fatty-acyl-CoA synthase